MNTKDLMIGDLVSIGSKSLEFYGIVKSIDVLEVYIESLLTGDIERHFKPSLKPILITTKILDKNGFVKVNSQRYDFGDPYGDYYINVNPKKKHIYINSWMGNCNLYLSDLTVHTFQHALRLCGLGNFADNFQV